MTHYLRTLSDRLLCAAGIISRKAVYRGPFLMSINVTNSCNLNCVACYFHSALNPDRYPKEWHSAMLDERAFCKLVDEARKLKIRSIIFSGQGEPFVHPNLLSFIKLAKERALLCDIFTNGTLIDPSVLNELSLMRLDSLKLSLWDPDPYRYEALRPGYGHYLGHIKEWLIYYRQNKNKKKFPEINVVFLINNKNYDCIQEMYDFAETYRIGGIVFKVMEILDSTTSDYMMNEEQIKIAYQLLRKFSDLKKRKIYSNAGEFCSMLEYARPRVGNYARSFFRKMPCYIGWVYTRVLVNGDVVPCCNGSDYVLGNIHQKTLSEIWHSREYREFRFYALTNKYTAAFRRCECDECCQNQINLKLNKFFGFLRQG